MAEGTQISEAEWQVMNVVWERQPVAAQDVVAALVAVTEWSPATIKTMLHRLVKKRALSFTQEGNRYLYRAAVRRGDCVRRASRSFLQRVFGGEAAPMLAHFVRSTRLTPDEIAELKRLLEDQEVKE
jgi:BlaI family penicillinase repressor